MSLKKKSVSGLVWQLLSISIQGLANIVYLMVMARLLSKDAFGVFAIASVLVAYVAMFSEVGFGAAVIQKQNLEDRDISFAFYTNLLLSILLFGLFVVLSPVASSFYNNIFSATFLLLLSIRLILKSFSTVSNALLIRELQFKKLFIANTSAFILGNLLVGIVLATMNFEEWSLLWALLATTMFTSIFIFALNPHSLRFRHKWKDGSYIFTYGYRLTLVRLLNQTANQSDKLIIGRLFPPSMLGVYERFQKVLTLPEMYLGRVADGVLFSSMAKIQDSKSKLQYVFCGFLSLGTMFMAIIGLYCFLFSEEIVEVVLGKKWVEEAYIFKLYAVVVFIQTFSRYSDTIVRATNGLLRSIRIKGVYMVLMICGILYGSQQDIIHVLYYIILAKIVHSVLMIFLSKRLMSISWISFGREFIPLAGLVSVFMFKYLILSYLIEDPWVILIASLVGDIVLLAFGIAKRRLFLTSTQCDILESIIDVVKNKWSYK